MVAKIVRKPSPDQTSQIEKEKRLPLRAKSTTRSRSLLRNGRASAAKMRPLRQSQQQTITLEDYFDYLDTMSQGKAKGARQMGSLVRSMCEGHDGNV